ncbi:MAG TPA: dienelactone hydrolase family protein [Tepidisphaeraceae bacterium]|nr:dienelactone hydrolase family protein [Tepidisphaeraceae bacterium]
MSILSLLSLAIPAGAQPGPLPGTHLLPAGGDLDSRMLDGIDRFLDRETHAALLHRSSFWKRDTASRQAYVQSVASNRGRLAVIVGVVDPREHFDAPELIATVDRSALIAKGEGYDIFAVRWPVLRGVWGEGLLLKPTTPSVADIVALPDADWTPEMLCGLSDGVPIQSQFARRLAERGCRVLIPTLASRGDDDSVAQSGRATNQTHREWIYRPAFEMGRHVIGYEIQKVLAAVDWFERDSAGTGRKIGVFGYGEGGLLALYAGALDSRIAAVGVSGYFGSRQALWNEPIYRNVFGLLREFGDAEIASLIVPRKLVIEACAGPVIDGPPPAAIGRKGAAPGVLVTPRIQDVRSEVARAAGLVVDLPEHDAPALAESGDGAGPCGGEKALVQFLEGVNVHGLGESHQAPAPLEKIQPDNAGGVASRQRRLVEQMSQYTQRLVVLGEEERSKYWAGADRKSRSPEKWTRSTETHRKEFERDVIGQFGEPLIAPNVRTVRIYDEPTYVGYQVAMDVWPDVIATGILLVPKGIKPGERRPVVVCQHGLDGFARDVANPKFDSPFYHRFACALAEEGFIAYAPQNPYFGGNRFRQLIRKANPLGATLWTFIVAQHRQSTDWLASLPNVDPDRIAFYGLSYGGKTAMRVPAVVERYCLSICSGDFNEWIWKCTSLRYPGAYPATQEYEMFEWNLGNTFNYAEMAGLIAPRPFMVERGHHDGVGLDEWVSYEYAKVRMLYDDLGIGDRTTIEYFDGPHTIHGVGTFTFLHERLKWPQKAAP